MDQPIARISIAQEDALKVALEQLDFGPIKAKMVYSNGWSIEYAREVEKWYKRFLFLGHKYRSESLVVNKAIDEFWHNHILDTRKYIEDCNALFGYYVHHFPYFGMRGKQDEENLQVAYERSNRLFLAEFGEVQMKTELGVAVRDGEEVDDAVMFQAASCSDCSGEGSCQRYSEHAMATFNSVRPTI